MTEPAPAPPAPAADAAVYSKDYWDNVFEQVGRRPLVKAALAVLALLYASAIYAPFLANDRPYYLVANDQKEYDRALKTLYAATASLHTLVEKGEAAHAASGRAITFGEAIAQEEEAARRLAGTLVRALEEEDRAGVQALLDSVGEVEQALQAGREEDALAAAAALRDGARELRKTHALADPARPEAGGKVLPMQRSWPLFESVGGVESFFALLWLCLLTWPLWNRFVNRRLLAGDRNAIRRRRKTKLFAVLGLSLAGSLIWMATIGGSSVFEAADYKPRIDSGQMQVEKVVWPPLAMGFAESNGSEIFRGPAWAGRKHQRDSEGFALAGARFSRTDETTGMARVAKPVEVRTAEPSLNSAWRHFLGADSLGRDLFVRILYGGRISLAVGIVSTVLLVFLGVVIGALAGYFGGWVDLLISRLIEIFQSIPAFFLILTAVALIPEEEIQPIFAIVILIALVRWTGIARLVRAEFLKLKEQEFVIAARALGFPSRRVIFGHVLPNALGPVLVAAAFSVAAGILTESSISFLGLGIKLPIPSWGSLLNEGRGTAEYWWLNVFPGLFIFITVFCYNVVGEGVRDALDPRRKV